MAGDVGAPPQPLSRGFSWGVFTVVDRWKAAILVAPGASVCRARLSFGGPLREEHSLLLLGSTRGSAQLSTMPEANYLFSVSWGYIKVCPKRIAIVMMGLCVCVCAHAVCLFTAVGAVSQISLHDFVIF